MSTKKKTGQKAVFKNCLQNKNDCIAGDTIYIECRKPGGWKLFRMSIRHHGNCCTARMNAKAIILKPYTNIKN